jgi:hypothetical protein
MKTGIAGIAWRRGAFRLWIVASVLWCAVMFSLPLSDANVTWSTTAAHTSPEVKSGWPAGATGPNPFPSATTTTPADGTTSDDFSLSALAERLKAAGSGHDPGAGATQPSGAPATQQTDSSSARAVRAWRAMAAAAPWAVGPPNRAVCLGRIALLGPRGISAQRSTLIGEQPHVETN